MRTTIFSIVFLSLTTHSGASISIGTQDFDAQPISPTLEDNADFGLLPGHTSTGPGLGYGITWTDTRSTGFGGPLAPSEGGDFIGVTDFVGEVGLFTSGSQGFQWNDGDGLIELVLEAVDSTAITGLTLNFDRFISSTSYESGDVYSVSVNGVVIDALDDMGLEAAGANSGWQSQALDLSAFDGLSSVVVTIGFDSNAGSENLYIDSLVFTGIPPCNTADLAEPFGILDLSDINTFTSGFIALDPVADLDENGIWDLTDINIFTSTFVAGCP